MSSGLAARPGSSEAVAGSVAARAAAGNAIIAIVHFIRSRREVMFSPRCNPLFRVTASLSSVLDPGEYGPDRGRVPKTCELRPAGTPPAPASVEFGWHLAETGP